MGSLNAAPEMEGVEKSEPQREGSSESLGSTPDLDADIAENYQQDLPQPQKRKGGRKPVSLYTSNWI
jgi:hypothetical protein